MIVILEAQGGRRQLNSALADVDTTKIQLAFFSEPAS